MTESEWLACGDPGPMLHFIEGQASDRKLRLFACACVREAWPRLTDERSRRAAEAGERLADGLATGEDLATAWSGAWEVVKATPKGAAWSAARLTGKHSAWATARVVVLETAWPAAKAAIGDAAANADLVAAQMRQASLLRDILGNPARPASFDAAWRTPEAERLAKSAYDERELPSGHLDAARLAVLSDALEEAGCAEDAILSHLRSPGPHVRGCWSLDLVLGKE